MLILKKGMSKSLFPFFLWAVVEVVVSMEYLVLRN